jgi:hypothetical protein
MLKLKRPSIVRGCCLAGVEAVALAMMGCGNANMATPPVPVVTTDMSGSGSGATPPQNLLDASVPHQQASGGGAGGATLPGVAGTHAGSAGGGAGAAGAAGSAAAGTGAGAGAAGSAGMAGGAACDRSCLLQMMQKYLDALIMHDPSKVPISASVKMTDNGVAAKPGDGLWKSASMLVQDERLDYADPVMKNVGSQCVINEGSTPAMYGVRLKVDGGEIVEIESMTVREADAANGFFDPSNLKPQPIFLQMPDAAKRMSRADMMAMQEVYLDYLEGKKSGSEVPFDDNCARYENGVATANGLAAFNAQSWGFMVTRRVLIIDEEAGITWGMFPFQQTDSALVVGEAFKMMGGKIMMIQAVMGYIPAKAWD